MAAHVHAVVIDRFSGTGIEQKPDLVAVEEPLEIRMGYGPENDRQQKSLAVTMRTPGHDFELVLGFLFTEGIIQSYGQVESIKYCEDEGRQEEKENIVRVELRPEVQIEFQRIQRNFYTTSSCGVCGKSSIESVRQQCSPSKVEWKVSANLIHRLPDALLEGQRVFEHTGGLHASGLFDLNGQLTLLREDVGRHNALDKVIGAMVAEKKLPLSQHILLVSGRASFELVQKAAMAGIPMLAAVGAPSSLAVNLASDCGMTLLGFVRDGKYNVYTGRERIDLN